MTIKIPNWARPEALSHGEMHAIVNRTVSPTGMQKFGSQLLAVAARQKKCVLWRSQNQNACTNGTSAAIYIWPVFFRTGEATTAIDIHVGVTVRTAGAGSPAELNCLVKRFSDGVTVSSATEHRINYAGDSSGASVDPSEVSHKTLHITGLAPDTEYVIENQVTNQMMVVYMLVEEAPVRPIEDTTAGVCNPDQFVSGGPIYDVHMEDLIEANNLLLKHNRSHLLSWTCDYEAQNGGAGIPSITGNTSYTDLYAGRPFTLATQYHNRRQNVQNLPAVPFDLVPCVMAVCAGRTAGTGTLDVRLTDGTNSIAVTGIGAGSTSGIRAAWHTASVSLPAGLGAGWHIEARQSNGTTTHKLFGVSLYEYET